VLVRGKQLDHPRGSVVGEEKGVKRSKNGRTEKMGLARRRGPSGIERNNKGGNKKGKAIRD